MPDIDPAALSRQDSVSGPSATAVASSKSLAMAAPAAQKAGKSVNTAQRIDLEPLYTALKSAVGEYWGEYKDSISLFVMGHLNQTELCFRIDHFITIDPSTEHKHNQLMSGIYGNVTRDLPDQGVASWVSANDKPTSISKPVSGDAAEQRLKTEVMQLPARDRRRLKDIPDSDPYESYNNAIVDYDRAKQIKLPDVVPASAGGLNKTNWELEIRKRYTQPLASETGEFPDTETLQNRLTPICYGEGIVNGSGTDTSVAAYMTVATETFVKEVLSNIFSRTRSNGPNYIMTAQYKRQLEREEEAWLRGEVLKNGNGMLPVEEKAARERRPLGMGDFRLALEMGVSHLGQMPLTVQRIMSGYLEGELGMDSDGHDDDGDGEEMGEGGGGGALEPLNLDVNGVNGASNGNTDDSREMDDSDWGWEGGGPADREALDELLDDCLAIGL
ncbi:MAG: transcriptional coactivator hfi1/ADA1 [Pycnora praestabilis]|nr:MAG: transcriptional coactivator hfi1/ADA1 [Pycnora praestabilis]